MSSQSEKDIECVREFYSTLNRNDLPAALACFDPQILRVEWEGLPTEGTFRGLKEMKAHMEKGRGSWAEGSCEPQKFIVAGDKIVVFVFVRVRLKDKTDWLEGRVADAFTLRNGKIIEFRSFTENQKALDWAGVKT